MAKNKSKGEGKKTAADKTASNTLNKNLPLPDPPPPPKERLSSQKREPLKQLSSSETNMSARRKNPKPAAKRALYRAEESIERLQRVGFDPRVTDLSPQQVYEQWTKTADILSYKPVTVESGPAGHSTRVVTTAPLTLTSAFCSDNRRRIDPLLPTPAPERFEGHEQDQPDQFGDVSSDKDSALGSDIASHAGSTEDAPHGHGMPGQADAAPTSSNSVKSADEAATQDLSLAGILRIPELGIMVLEEVFQTGFHNVEKLAMTSLKMLGLVRRLLMVMDCTGGELANAGVYSTMLLAVAPEVTIGDFRRARDRDPCGMFDFNFIKGWCEDALKEESYDVGTLVRLACGKRTRFFVKEDTKRIVKNLKMKWDENVFTNRRIVRGADDEIYQPSIQREARGLQNLLTQLREHKATLSHVHFHKLPLLDRRVLAAVLRECEKITSVSIEACPLLHVGDLVSILDEIHAINLERGKKGLNQISALNFGPMYERGMPYASEGRSETYGLTWDPIRFDISQIGLYAILLKAFFKAHTMGIENLFDKNGALMHFLLKLPTDPQGIPIFLDACYRLVNRLATTKDVNDLQLRKAVYDMLRIVRLGFSWPESTCSAMDYFNDKMMKGTMYCTTCGYRLLDAFFFSLKHVSDERICYGCMLQGELDGQSHHLRKKKRACLDLLFPDHQALAIGHEAPVGKNPLLSLESTTPEDPSLPTAQFTDEGIVMLPDTRKRRRETRSSLVGVWPNPTLFGTNGEGKKVWKRFFEQCQQVDLFRTAASLFHDLLEEGGSVDAVAIELARNLTPRGRPNHHLERQFPLRTDITTFTHAQAKQRHLELVHEGAMPGTVAKLSDEDDQAAFEQAQTDSFW